jgi:hypothetical protein
VRNKEPNTSVYYYSSIFNKTSGKEIPTFSVISIKNCKCSGTLVYLGSLVISQNGSQSWVKGSDNEEIVNLV